MKSGNSVLSNANPIVKYTITYYSAEKEMI